MPTPVIIDTDPGVDDVIALLYALACPELEILAILISFGNTDVDASYDNVLKVYNTLHAHFERFPADRARFPNFPLDPRRRPLLARGAPGPLEGELYSAEYFHGRDGLGDIAIDHPELTVGMGGQYVLHSPLPAHDLALELLRERPEGSVTYIVLGPMTNLAMAVRKDPEGARRVGRVVCMGGALDVPGNTSPAAEFNFFADPYAVKELLVDDREHGGIPKDRFVILPLDITTPHELPFKAYAERVDPAFLRSPTTSSTGSSREESTDVNQQQAEESPNPIAYFTSAFLRRARKVMREFGKDAMELHDVVAVWCAAQNPPSLDSPDADALQGRWKTRSRLFQVERHGELTRGMLVVDRRGEYIALAPSYINPVQATATEQAEEPGRFGIGDNRAEADAAFRRALLEHNIPAPVQQESATEAETAYHPVAKGIACVTETPGADVLLRSMLERIWGVTT